jgi:hypothetical protein
MPDTDTVQNDQDDAVDHREIRILSKYSTSCLENSRLFFKYKP